MGVFFDETKQIEQWLSERGLNKEEIGRGMKFLLGEDWKQKSAHQLLDSLRANGFTISNEMPFFADELEALVRGAIKLADFYRRR